MSKDIFDTKPQLPDYKKFGPEPSLRELIFKYYKAGGFDNKESIELTDAYISELQKS